MSKRILIIPLLILTTFVVIVVLFFMLVFGAFSGGGDESADDGPAQEQPAEAPKADDEPKADDDTDAAEDTDAEAPEATTTEPKQEDPIAAADLDIGDCISDALSTLGDVTTFDEAECDEPHDGEVYTLIKLPGAAGARYPGTEEVTAKGQRGCRARLRRQATSDAFRDSQLGYKFVYPTALSWKDGDREITCLATFKKPRSETLAQR